MALTLSASSSCGPPGNSVQVTVQPWWRQPLFQQAALLEEHQRSVLLDADAQLALGRERGQRQCARPGAVRPATTSDRVVASYSGKGSRNGEANA